MNNDGYHICHDAGTFRNGDLAVGMTIVLSPFRGPSEPPADEIQQWRGIEAGWNRALPEGVSFWGNKVLLGLVENFVGEREMRAEEIRQAYFPTYPSRFQAVFACRTLDDAKRYRASFDVAHASIWKLRAAKVLERDMNWLKPASQPELDSNLHRYWAGEESEHVLWEWLMIPPVQVIERIDN